jgi:glycosyltransferase involved in cell wall biosynthesis
MRVALNGYFWDQPRTGSGQYLRHLWRALPETLAPVGSAPGGAPGEGEHLDLVMLHPRGSGILDYGSPQIQNRLTPLDKFLWEGWGVMSAAVREGAQLLHVPYLSAPFAKRVPVVVTAHDMIPWVVPGYGGSPTVRLYLALAAAAVKRADLIIADSEASRRDALRVLKVPPGKVHTVYLGAVTPPEHIRQQLDEVRSRHGLPSEFAFYLGGFDRRKNVPLLLRAWRGAVDRLAAEWCAEDCPVRFLGGVTEEDKSMLMAAARLFVYPSAYEGFGLDPLQAMSAGCPVVSSSGGSLQEVVGDAGLLAPPDDVAALRDAIVRAWTDDALRSRLSTLGKARARSFTWQRTAEQTAALYSLALKRSRRQ